MFTLRFIDEQGDYTSFSARRYSVKRQPGGAVIVFSSTYEVADECSERVGGDSQYKIAYVSNEFGKTVDTVRATK